MNVAVYGTDNVSQFAVSLLLEVCSHIGHHSDSVHAGEWAENADWCYWHYPMIEVAGKISDRLMSRHRFWSGATRIR